MLFLSPAIGQRPGNYFCCCCSSSYCCWFFWSMHYQLSPRCYPYFFPISPLPIPPTYHYLPTLILVRLYLKIFAADPGAGIGLVIVPRDWPSLKVLKLIQWFLLTSGQRSWSLQQVSRWGYIALTAFSSGATSRIPHHNVGKNSMRTKF